MKARRVTIMLEVITGLPIKSLRDKEWWKVGMETSLDDPDLQVLQIQAFVIKKGNDWLI